MKSLWNWLLVMVLLHGPDSLWPWAYRHLKPLKAGNKRDHLLHTKWKLRDEAQAAREKDEFLLPYSTGKLLK